MIILLIGLLALAALIYGSIRIWKENQKQFRFRRLLGLYEIVASIHGIVVGFYLIFFIAKTSIAGIVILSILFLAGGILGIVAGRKLMAGESFQPSLWWGLMQLPMFELNLHWVFLQYSYKLLFALPVSTSIFYENTLHFNVHFDFTLLGSGAFFSTYFLFPGEGFNITLGANLVAAAFLILVYRLRKKSQKTFVTPLAL